MQGQNTNWLTLNIANERKHLKQKRANRSKISRTKTMVKRKQKKKKKSEVGKNVEMK